MRVGRVSSAMRTSFSFCLVIDILLKMGLHVVNSPLPAITTLLPTRARPNYMS